MKINQAKLNVYPNPGNGKFNLELSDLPQGGAEIEVYNATGKLMMKNKAGNFNNMDLSDQPNGIYIIRIVCEDQSVTQRIIKQ